MDHSPEQPPRVDPDIKKHQDDDDKLSIKDCPINIARQGVELPELLSGLSEAELKELEKKFVRKIDTRMLPALIITCTPAG